MRRLHHALTAALSGMILLIACSDSDSGGPSAPVDADGGASEAAASSSGGQNTDASSGADASSNDGPAVFVVDGVPSTSQDKVSVSTFTDDRVAVNFGVQVLSAPTDYTFLLTFRLDKEKTGSGAFGMEAVKSVEGLLRDANTAATWSTTWEPDDTQGVAVELSVANDTITASWKGPVSAASGDGTRDVEARVTSLPSTKK